MGGKILQSFDCNDDSPATFVTPLLFGTHLKEDLSMLNDYDSQSKTFIAWTSLSPELSVAVMWRWFGFADRRGKIGNSFCEERVMIETHQIQSSIH